MIYSIDILKTRSILFNVHQHVSWSICAVVYCSSGTNVIITLLVTLPRLTPVYVPTSAHYHASTAPPPCGTQITTSLPYCSSGRWAGSLLLAQVVLVLLLAA